MSYLTVRDISIVTDLHKGSDVMLHRNWFGLF